MDKALILLAHGSRDPSWAQPFEALTAALKEKHPVAGSNRPLWS